MENPLQNFKDFINNIESIFLRNDFIKNSSYDKGDDTIFDVVTDGLTEETHEVRRSYKQYISGIVGSKTRNAINVLDKNLHGLISEKDQDDYICKIEGEIDYLLNKLPSQEDPANEVLSKELNQIKDYIRKRYKYEAPSSQPANAITEKLVWKGNPAIFFMLFQELHTRGLMGTGSRKDSLAKFSKLLYEMIDVPPLNSKKAGYTQSSFEQNFKPSGGLQDYPNYSDLKDLIDSFIDKINKEAKKL